MTRRILVIRLGALGDFVLSFRAFAAIRAHHGGDHVTLLTTPPFAGLAADSPWFDTVVPDGRPPWWSLPRVLRLRRLLRAQDFIYDLQTSRRTDRYFLLAGAAAPWSGTAPGCSHPHDNPGRNDLHTVERQRDQLARAGIVDIPRPDLGWLARRGPVLPFRYALLIPGTSDAHGGAKRWPIPRFAALACIMAARDIRPVVVGVAADRTIARDILIACPQAIDFTGRTSLQDLAGLASRAAFAIGGDTGPTHLAAAMGTEVVALFSRFSDPGLAGPIGRTRILRAADLRDLPLDRVAACLPGN